MKTYVAATKINTKNDTEICETLNHCSFPTLIFGNTTLEIKIPLIIINDIVINSMIFKK